MKNLNSFLYVNYFKNHPQTKTIFILYIKRFNHSKFDLNLILNGINVFSGILVLLYNKLKIEKHKITFCKLIISRIIRKQKQSSFCILKDSIIQNLILILF